MVLRPPPLHPPGSGIAWKNMPGCGGAAEWARHGEGGSGHRPLFAEARTVARPALPGSGWAVPVVAALVGAMLGATWRRLIS